MIMFKKISDKILKGIDYLLGRASSQQLIGGLEISDSSIRFLRLGGATVKSVVSLPPGIILNGEVKDRANLLGFLKTLHGQLTQKEKTVLPVVVSLPPESIFTKSFSVPAVEEDALEEAVNLNLKMVSPIENLETAYYHWQKIGVGKSDGGKVDVLSAFVNRSLVDVLSEVLKEAGFQSVAFEFPALALARVFKKIDNRLGLFLTLNILTDGLDFSIIYNGELYFSYFKSWRSVYGEQREIKFGEFQSIISQEVQKIINFSRSHFQDSLQETILVAPSFEKEIGEMIQKSFSFKVTPLKITQYGDISTSWFGVLGSALRGQMNRAEDEFISLYGVNARKEFYQNQTISFIKLWRNVFGSAIGILLVAFAGANLFLRVINNDLANQIRFFSATPEVQKMIELQQAATQFNRSVALVKAAKLKEQEPSPLFNKLYELAGSQVLFDRILVQSFTAPISLFGRAVSERAAIDFKNKLAEQSQFKDVVLPLASVTPTERGLVSFNVRLTVANFNF